MNCRPAAAAVAACLIGAAACTVTGYPAAGPDPGAAAVPASVVSADTPEERAARLAIDLGVPTALDPAGMARLAEAIGDARIVMLGEQWHGDGGTIRLLTEVVKYLHREHGFAVLVFESDFYGVHQGWRQSAATGEVRHAAGNIQSFWTSTAAAASLWQYASEAMQRGDTLHIAGMDTQMTGALSRQSLPDSLRARLLRHTDATPGDATRAAAVLAAALRTEPGPADVLTPEGFALLLRLVTELEQRLASDPAERFWAQVANSMRRNLSGENRGAGMAANLVWLATRQYPDRRLIVWAHNNHILSDKWVLFDAPDPLLRETILAGTSEIARGRSTYLGTDARHFFGPRLFVLPTIVQEGSYSPDIGPALRSLPADFDRLAPLAPAGPGTLEHALAARGHDVAFLDLQRTGIEDGAALRSRVLDYSQSPPAQLRLRDGYDGLLFLRRTHGLNELPPE